VFNLFEASANTSNITEVASTQKDPRLRPFVAVAQAFDLADRPTQAACSEPATNWREDLMREGVSSEIIQILILLAALVLTLVLSCLRGSC
jgi:hypothetical protein